MRKSILSAISLVLFGCSSINYHDLSVEEIYKYQSVEDSEFESSYEINGGQITYDAPGGFLDVGRVYLNLRGWVDKKDTSVHSHQLYLDFEYSGPGGWRRYERASFLGGGQADVMIIKRNVNFCQSTRCDYTEVIGIDIPIRKIITAGDMRIQISAKSGHKTEVSIPQNYLLAYFDLINSLEVK